jgi:hypothetical protein
VVGRLGEAEQDSRGRSSSKRGVVWQLNRRQRTLLRENRKAGETANGIAGRSKRYGSYFSGQETLNERRIPEEDAFEAATP